MSVFSNLVAAAQEATDILGVPIAVIAPLLAAIVAAGATRFSTMQSRATARDQIVAQTASVLAQDNAALRDEVRDIKREAHSASIEARAARRRVGELEDAMRTAGVPIPPET